jgi:hypothetical protein
MPEQSVLNFLHTLDADMTHNAIGKDYLTMGDVVLDNKRVLVRVDFNL